MKVRLFIALWLMAGITLAQGLTMQQRGQRLIDRLAEVYALSAPGREGASMSVPDPEKYNWPAVIGRFEKYGPTDSVGNRRIRTFANNSPFHFTLVGMARIMYQYPTAPDMARLKNQYLQNVFNRTDSYNAWTAEGTENHTAMTRPSGYLYAQAALGNPSFPTAAARMAEMKTWILAWSKRLYETGNGEWNSSTYNPYAVIGWLNLYDYAQDPEVKACARAVLDWYVADMAINYQKGVTAGAESRGLATTSVRTGSDYLAWYWFGDVTRRVDANFWNGNDWIQAVHAITSTYRPHPQAIFIARKQMPNPEFIKMGRPSYLLEQANYVKNQLYLHPVFSLGSSNSGYAGYTGGTTQLTNWKLVDNPLPNDSSSLPNYVSGNGNYFSQATGRGKTPFDQIVQHENVLIQMTKVPTDYATVASAMQAINNTWQQNWQRDFSLRFPGDNKPNPVNFTVIPSNVNILNMSYINLPNSATVVRNATAGVMFVELNNVYLAVHSINRPLPMLMSFGNPNGRTRWADSAALGQMCGIVLEVTAKGTYPTFAAYQSAYTAVSGRVVANPVEVTYLTLDQQSIRANYNSGGVTSTVTEPIYDWGWGPTTPQNLQTSPPFVQPAFAASIGGNGRYPSLTVNNQVTNYQTAYYPIFGGSSYMRMDTSVLAYTTPNSSSVIYAVNYKGRLPIFLPDTSNPTQVAGKLLAVQPLQLWPNPASQRISVVLPKGVTQDAAFTLVATDGRSHLIRATETNQGIANLVIPAALPRGLYNLSLSQGGRWYRSSLVIE